MGRTWQLMRDEALAAKARDWKDMILFAIVLRRVLPVAAVAAVLGGLGFLAHMAWVSVTRVGPDSAPAIAASAEPVHTGSALGAVPLWLWLVAALFAVALTWMCRPGQVTTRGDRRLRWIPAGGLVLTMIGIAGVALSAVGSG